MPCHWAWLNLGTAGGYCRRTAGGDRAGRCSRPARQRTLRRGGVAGLETLPILEISGNRHHSSTLLLPILTWMIVTIIRMTNSTIA